MINKHFFEFQTPEKIAEASKGETYVCMQTRGRGYKVSWSMLSDHNGGIPHKHKPKLQSLPVQDSIVQYGTYLSKRKSPRFLAI